MASRPSYGEGALPPRTCVSQSSTEARALRAQMSESGFVPLPADARLHRLQLEPHGLATVRAVTPPVASNALDDPQPAPPPPHARAPLGPIHTPPPPTPPGPLGPGSRVLGSSSASSWTSTCSRPSSSSTRRLTIPEPCLTAFAISSVVSRAASSITSSATPQPSSNLSRNARPADAESGRPGIWASATCGSVFPPFMTSLLSRWATQPQRARPSDGGDCDASVPDPWGYETRAAYTRQDTTS